MAFDTTTAFLDAQTLTSARALINKHTVRKRDEYESSEEFRTRQTAAVDGSIYAVQMGRDCGLGFRYDPDTERMSVDPSVGHMLASSNFLLDVSSMLKPGSFLPATCWTESKGSYVGTNAFGVSVKVNRQHEQALGFLADRRVRQMGDLSWKISRDSARAIRPHLAAALVVRPALFDGRELLSTAEDWRPAKIDSPTETSESSTALSVNLAQLWVYDRRTGEVVTSFDLLRND